MNVVRIIYEIKKKDILLIVFSVDEKVLKFESIFFFLNGRKIETLFKEHWLDKALQIETQKHDANTYDK